jgi:hypothetical protein
MNQPSQRLADRFLERALLFTMASHLAAMATMALFLMPGIPGGGVANVADRAHYIVNHAALWRIGWFPWHVTAISDIVLAVALCRSCWVPKLPATLALLATLVAVSIEQPNEFRWITTGVELAQRAIATSDYGEYLNFETATFRVVSLWAAMWYTIAAICWSWSFAAAGTWNRFLTWISVAVWGILLFVSAGPLLLGSDRISDQLIAVGNAVGFILMMIWFVVVTELVLRRSRPDEMHGRYAAWRHPHRGAIGSVLDLISNARLPRAMGELLPSLAFVSDITNVVYVNYLVDATQLQRLVPASLKLQQLGPGGRYALFTFLTYRHGHFGPRLLGPLRKLLPSPIQTNWRIHVYDPNTGVLGIYFISTAITALPNALAARFLSEGVPMHVPHRAELTRHPDDSIALRIDPGAGSSPDVEAIWSPAEIPTLSAPWNECFADFRAFLEYCVPQDRAMSSQPWYRRITRQEIRLDIPLDVCRPLTGNVLSQAAREIAGDATPLCFAVPAVGFRYDGEAYDAIP